MNTRRVTLPICNTIGRCVVASDVFSMLFTEPAGCSRYSRGIRILARGTSSNIISRITGRGERGGGGAYCPQTPRNTAHILIVAFQPVKEGGSRQSIAIAQHAQREALPTVESSLARLQTAEHELQQRPYNWPRGRLDPRRTGGPESDANDCARESKFCERGAQHTPVHSEPADSSTLAAPVTVE